MLNQNVINYIGLLLYIKHCAKLDFWISWFLHFCSLEERKLQFRLAATYKRPSLLCGQYLDAKTGQMGSHPVKDKSPVFLALFVSSEASFCTSVRAQSILCPTQTIRRRNSCYWRLKKDFLIQAQSSLTTATYSMFDNGGLHDLPRLSYLGESGRHASRRHQHFCKLQVSHRSIG